MNLKRSPFSILNKERREIDHHFLFSIKKEEKLIISREFIREKFKLKLNLIKILKMKIREIQFKLKMY